MRAVKIISVILLVVAIGIAGLVFYTVRNLDQLVQAAVERFGSDVTQTEVTVEGVDIHLREGRARLSNLVVANPAGYTSDYAFSLDTIAVEIVPTSLGTGQDDVVVIEEISIDGASIIAETQGLRDSNLQELAANIRSNLPAGSGEQQAQPETPADYTGPNFRVQRFTFSNADIALVSEQFGDRTLDMPTVTATDLGGERGLPPSELTAALLDQVLAQATEAVRDELERAAKSELQKRVEENLKEDQLQNLRDLLNR
jgi:hypothetical protein